MVFDELMDEEFLFFVHLLKLLEGIIEDKSPPVLEKVRAAEAAAKESRAIPAIRYPITPIPSLSEDELTAISISFV